jgi:hypothetical protein
MSKISAGSCSGANPAASWVPGSASPPQVKGTTFSSAPLAQSAVPACEEPTAGSADLKGEDREPVARFTVFAPRTAKPRLHSARSHSQAPARHPSGPE